MCGTIADHFGWHGELDFARRKLRDLPPPLEKPQAPNRTDPIISTTHKIVVQGDAFGLETIDDASSLADFFYEFMASSAPANPGSGRSLLHSIRDLGKRFRGTSGE